MKHLVGWWSLGVVAALATSAHAERSPALDRAAEWVVELRNEYRSSAGDTRAAECTKEIGALRTKGTKTVRGSSSALKELGGTMDPNTGDYTLSIDAAAKVCAQATLYTTALAEYELFSDIARNMYLLSTEFKPGPEFVKKELEKADRCDKAVDAMLAAKVPATLAYVVTDNDGKPTTRTVADLKAKVCDANRKAASQYTKAAADQARAYEERLTKAGLADDKLYWFKHYDGNLFLAGGKTPSDIKQYAAASVWFAYIFSPDPDVNGNHLFTLRRYQFSGSKLAKQTEKTFKKPLSFRTKIAAQMK